MSIQRLQSGRWLNWGIRFFLTAALTASQTAGGYAPFALGCIAAAGPGADGAAALLGGVTGALLFLDFQQVLALAAVGILILTAATAFRDTAFLQKPWVLPVLAAGMVLAVDGIYVLQSLDPLSHAAPCAAASALTGVSAHFFTRLFQPEEDRLAPEGLLFLGAALTLALGDLTILNVSVGRVLLCALLAYTAYDQGPMTGVTAGLGLGLITDLSAGTSGLFTAAYGVAGLCAAKCRRRSMAALAFFSGAAAAMLTSREELAQTLLLETVAGSLLFLALPRRIFGGKRLLREAAPNTAQRTALKTHLNRAAEARRELSAPGNVDDTIIGTSEAERLFVRQFEEAERFNLSVLSPIAAESMVFYSPVASGVQPEVDSDATAARVSSKSTLPVSAIYRGSVVSAVISGDRHGSVVIIQHPNDFLSIYSGLDDVFVKPGDKVVAGQRIGHTGPGEVMSFELWHGGIALAPADYIGF